MPFGIYVRLTFKCRRTRLPNTVVLEDLVGGVLPPTEK